LGAERVKEGRSSPEKNWMRCIFLTDSQTQTRSEIMVWTNQRDARAARTPDHRMSCPQQAIGGSANFRSSCSSV